MTSPVPLPPGRFVDPSRPLTFTFEGRRIPALQGQSIAAALYAAGIRIFSRSFKYHRPRGLFCVSGDCPNCLMQVDGVPNVRTCIEPAQDGQVVRSQNAWPGLQFDMLRVFDHLDQFLPVGFYYKRFHKPRWLWPIFEHVVRHIAGLGRIDVRSRPSLDREVEHLHTEVCVVGAGPAGLNAAEWAAAAGAEVLLLDKEPYPGGHFLYDCEVQPEHDAFVAELGGHPRVHFFPSTYVFGLYEGNLLGAFNGSRFLKIRAQQIIICTGGRERPFLFENNDLPGVMLSRGILRLAHLHGVRAGRRAVVLTDDDEGAFVARRLMSIGIDVVAIVDQRTAQGARGREIYARIPAVRVTRGTILRAHGVSHVEAVTVARLRDDGTVQPGFTDEIECDLVCLASKLQPANELLLQGGMRFHFVDGRWRPRISIPGLWAAGDVAGTTPTLARSLEGSLRGAQAAAALGYSVSGLEKLRREYEAALTTHHSPLAHHSPLTTDHSPGKCFVCLCEDVTAKDIEQAVAEGFDHIETLKRYATASMGPCQGKMCGTICTELCAGITGREVNAVGTTTSRPPVVPVELAVLAAERWHHPVRRTPMHHWHEQAGARWMDAGQWKRPESYGDVLGEVRAVRTGVGLIDVSTLGKIELIGPDAAELLERVYINGWSDLAVGRARYGVMCNEDGVVFDDGVGTRLGPNHFYLTATTGNAEAVFQWLELWRATWRLNVIVLNRTSAFAAMNVAGPQAREVLSQLTKLDLSRAAFPYPAVREADVAGVACRLLRVGFVGEVGYEIHCPTARGWHLWTALLGAGARFGIRCFGVEAQRVLRLEKGHIVIGQDTDALSDPMGAGLERLVRFSKPLFHGREALLRLKQLGGPRSRLVGFEIPTTTTADGDWLRQLEGCQIVEEGRPVGRVTSARYSPTLQKYIGLAWLPAGRAAAGDFLVRHNGGDLPARVAALPFYDPEGKRVKN